MTPRPPVELKLWIWLKANGLSQTDLADGIERSKAHVSYRIKYSGFTVEERKQILSWARRMRPKAAVTTLDLFEPEAA